MSLGTRYLLHLLAFIIAFLEFGYVPQQNTRKVRAPIDQNGNMASPSNNQSSYVSTLSHTQLMIVAGVFGCVGTVLVASTIAYIAVERSKKKRAMEVDQMEGWKKIRLQ